MAIQKSFAGTMNNLCKNDNERDMKTPSISVVIPVYNGERHLAEALDSIISQTLMDWECLIINEFGSNDASAAIAQKYSKQDSRFRLVQNEQKLGLAASLNKGIQLARGTYIARLDADDLARSDRFEKQRTFMEAHPEVVVCGSWQHHFGQDTDWIHKCPENPDQCKANLLFFCDLCHSTLLLRKDALTKYQLEYNPAFLAEDFELWTRVIGIGEIANIPEVLGEYRWEGDNITVAKKEQLHKESGQIVANSLKRYLDLELTPEETELFCNWRNPIESIPNRSAVYAHMQRVLRAIYERNEEIGFFNRQCLLNAISAKWRWFRYYDAFNEIHEVADIDAAFAKRKSCLLLNRIITFWQHNKGIKKKIQKCFHKALEYWYR